MIVLQKEVEFDAGHRVSKHGGKCRSPHGHRWRVRASFTGDVHDDTEDTPEAGMVVDFGFLKQILMAVHDRYDHGFLLWNRDDEMLSLFGGAPGDWKVVVVPWIPTAENMATAILADLNGELLGLPIRCYCVEVWETPTSCAAVTA